MMMILDIIPLFDLFSKSDTSVRYVEQFIQNLKKHNDDIHIPPKSRETKVSNSTVWTPHVTYAMTLPCTKQAVLISMFLRKAF